MRTELGIIEGFYGKPWSWQERADNIAFFARRGFRFYLYAPKADHLLRRRWQDEYDDATAEQLAKLALHCREHSVRFGVGLSPYDAFRAFDDASRDALARKLAFFDQIGVEDLAILFDDMQGDIPNLAELQVTIVDYAAKRTSAQRLIVCPSYYTDDPILDRIFGARPPDYLPQLGTLLDPAIHIFWTGEEVISREYSSAHLERVSNELRRKPFLWDNYPVNDGQRMSQFLHVRGVTGRPASMGDHIAAHGVNPALQPTLTRIPLLTLVESYTRDTAYEYGAATRRAAIEVLGESLGPKLHEDVLVVQDVGLDRLGEKAVYLRGRYAGVDHPGAREIIAWLDGAYRITDKEVQAQ